MLIKNKYLNFLFSFYLNTWSAAVADGINTYCKIQWNFFLILENGVCLFPWNTIIKTENPLMSLDPTHFIWLRKVSSGFIWWIWGFTMLRVWGVTPRTLVSIKNKLISLPTSPGFYFMLIVDIITGVRWMHTWEPLCRCAQ